MRRNESGLPFLIGGLLLAGMLIFVTFRGNPPDDLILSRRFAPRPTDPSAPTAAPIELPQVSLPDLPPELQTHISDVTKQLAGGQAIPALTPTIDGLRVRVNVRELRRSGERVSVRGSVANLSTETVEIAPAAFIFRDSAGITYATEGSDAARLAPGAETNFDLAVPLPSGRGLTMIVSLPPDPPTEQVLIVELR